MIKTQVRMHEEIPALRKLGFADYMNIIVRAKEPITFPREITVRLKPFIVFLKKAVATKNNAKRAAINLMLEMLLIKEEFNFIFDTPPLIQCIYYADNRYPPTIDMETEFRIVLNAVFSINASLR